MAGRAKSKNFNNNGKVRIADNGYKFPEQLPVGELLIDSFKNEWVLGKAIARGGFGEIYEARPSLIKSNLPIKKNKDYEYVVKVDNFVGPLFCEMNFYIRVAKHEFITKWMSDKGNYRAFYWRWRLYSGYIAGLYGCLVTDRNLVFLPLPQASNSSAFRRSSPPARTPSRRAQKTADQPPKIRPGIAFW